MTIHRFLRTLITATVLTSTLGLSTGCVAAAPRGRVYVRVGPPAPIVERRIVAPGPGYVWVEGYHRWDGNRFVWVGGRWERPPRSRAVWVPGHWNHDGRGYYWVDGRWR